MPRESSKAALQRFGIGLLAAATALLTGACQTGGSSVSPSRVLDTVSTARTVADIARARDPQEAARQALKRRADAYERDPRLLLADAKRVKREYDNLVALLRGEVGKTWGRKEVKIATPKTYVKYTQNYRSRAVVDFDTGAITVETVDETNPVASLRNAVVTTLLTPDDPRATDLFSDSAVKLSSEKKPYLLGLVVDARGRPIATPEQAEAFADRLLAGRGTRTVEIDGGEKTATFVKLAMVGNFSHKQAEKYRPLVERYARQHKISPSLVYAIIKTESAFNPFARSSAPAFGLMQLVPTSGGREAYRVARGEDGIPSKDYLFDPENNIELGVTYLNILTFKQLERVENPAAREYCVISAYNTGPSNVLRAFSKDKDEAVNIINSLQPPEIYRRLRAQLPYDETRQYLQKVVGARREFLSFN
jgi:membrane-bound lytic murein transglycosylase C